MNQAMQDARKGQMEFTFEHVADGSVEVPVAFEVGTRFMYQGNRWEVISVELTSRTVQAVKADHAG